MSAVNRDDNWYRHPEEPQYTRVEILGAYFILGGIVFAAGKGVSVIYRVAASSLSFWFD
jgi:hypothetical protein